MTNRIPRRQATRLVGWLSRMEQPLVARASIALWRLFGDIDLSDAETTRFASMHACFTRRLRPGARVVNPDPAILASPCDAIIGASGRISGDEMLQVKGRPYRLTELLDDPAAAARLEGSSFVTLRLTAGMYHHFHAPHDLLVQEVRHIHGDCWNVNTPALKRVDRLFCRNERAAIRCKLVDGDELVLVAVAAILVAGIRLCFVDGGLRALQTSLLRPEVGIGKGEEMGWFEHGSTVVMIAPPKFVLMSDLHNGGAIKMGAALFRSGETS